MSSNDNMLIGDTYLIHVKKQLWIYNVKTEEQDFILPPGNYTGHVVRSKYNQHGTPWLIIDQEGEKNLAFPNGSEVGMPILAWRNWPKHIELTRFVNDEE